MSIEFHTQYDITNMSKSDLIDLVQVAHKRIAEMVYLEERDWHFQMLADLNKLIFRPNAFDIEYQNWKSERGLRVWLQIIATNPEGVFESTDVNLKDEKHPNVSINVGDYHTTIAGTPADVFAFVMDRKLLLVQSRENEWLQLLDQAKPLTGLGYIPYGANE